MGSILNLKGFNGEIEIKDSQFLKNKIYIDFSLSFDPTSVVTQPSSGILQKREGMISRNLIYVSDHTLGFTLRECLFQNNSGLNGLVFINISPNYS